MQSCVIDGEAIVTDENGLAVFELIRHHRTSATAVLCAFDLLELDGEDLRRQPIEVRTALLADLLHDAPPTIAVNEHYDGDGVIVFKHACKLGCEGIVSKRRGLLYRSGRSTHWLKVKNPAAPALRREAEEDWNQYEEEPGRRAAANLMTQDEARRIALGIAKLPDLVRR